MALKKVKTVSVEAQESSMISVTTLAIAEKEASPALIDQANALVITSDSERMAAEGIAIELKARVKRLEGVFEPQRESTYRAYQTVLDQKKKFMGVPEQALKIVNKKISAYQVEQERIREEARQEAIRLAEEEAEREKAKLLKKADKLESKGKIEEANLLREQAGFTFAAPVQTGDIVEERTEGMSSRDDWDIEMVNPMELIKAIANGSVNINLDSIITWKVGGFKSYIKIVGVPHIPGLSIKKIKIQSISLKGEM